MIIMKRNIVKFYFVSIFKNSCAKFLLPLNMKAVSAHRASRHAGTDVSIQTTLCQP